MSSHYKIHEFAKLAGVTVKALHHYDRLGLLQPGRTEAGYRVYCDRDLETLEQIVALKFLGIPLKEIGLVLKRAAQLPDALRLQRRALEDKHALLGRAIRAIQAAEKSLESGQPVDAAILKKIIEVIDMQNDMQSGIEVMKKYYSDEAWAKLVKLRENESEHSRMWQARVDLFADIEKALLLDPAGEIAQTLVARWQAQLDEASGGDPEIKTALVRGWSNRRHWPPSVRWQVEGLHMMSFERFERCADFLDRAAAFEKQETMKESPAMKTTQTVLAEFNEEMANTRKMLERIPNGKFAWKPHEKSFTLGKLANHIAALPIGIAFVITGQGGKPSEAASIAELLEAFDQRAAAARDALAGTSEDHLAGTIMVAPGVSKTRVAAMKWFMNHLIHHRGQLSVYLRLLDVAVPGMYGSSADEKSS